VDCSTGTPRELATGDGALELQIGAPQVEKGLPGCLRAGGTSRAWRRGGCLRLLLFEASLRGCELYLRLGQRQLQAFENAVVVDCDPAADEGKNDEYGQKQAQDHDHLSSRNSRLDLMEIRREGPILRRFNSGVMLLPQQSARGAERNMVPA